MVGARLIERGIEYHLLKQLAQRQPPERIGYRVSETLPDKERQRILTQKLLEVAIPYLIESITTSSAANSKKFLYLYDLLQHVKLQNGYTAADLITLGSLPEEPGEDEWHHLKGIDGDPARIAACKAEFSNLHSRRKHVLNMVIQGRGRVFSMGNDVMTQVVNGSGEIVDLFKPNVKEIKSEQERKEALYQWAIQHFGVSESGDEMITVKCINSLAMFEGISKIGVSEKREISIQMRVPPKAFWQCYFWGTESEEAQQYPTMVREFNRIYSDMIQNGRLDLLRGWTPRSGAMGTEKVNGAFHTDCAFARMLYIRIWNGQQWIDRSMASYNEFEELSDESAALWQGKPVLFPQVFLKLIEYLRLHEEDGVFPPGEMQSEFLSARRALSEIFGEGTLSGQWFGFRHDVSQITSQSVDQIVTFVKREYQRRRQPQ